MKKTITMVLVCSLLCSQLIGFVTESSADQGATIGGVVGALFGAAVSKKNKAAGALIGGVVGVLAGAAIGNYIDKQNATRDEATKNYQYDAKSEQLEVEHVDLSPQLLSPGSKMETTVRYTILAPDSGKEVKLTERRTLLGEQDSFDLPAREVIRAQGTHTSTSQINLPKDLPKGNYTLVTIISDGKNTKTSKTPFIVA